MTIDCVSLMGNSCQTEIKLERSGDINALQTWRAWEMYGHSSLSKPFEELLGVEECMRELAQGELRGTESPKEINERYWKAERKWWAVKSRFKDCPFTRGLKLWRSNPNWDMHPVLVEDCAGRGGCCGKGCGCCAKRQYLYEHSRKLAIGHCTFSCLCCKQTRGFKLDKEEREVQER